MCHCTSTCQLLFFLSLYIPCRDLHSFPTRRSSDLEGGVVLLAGGAFSVVVGAGGGVGQRGERCQEECSFELLVDRKSTRLNSSHVAISYAVFCLKKKKMLVRYQ